jgi:JmjC domain, hydroxylase
VDFYGADAYIYLVSGEKLWIYAPPEKAKEFDAMFKRPHKAATIRLTKAEKAYMQQHHIRVIHQRADEVVFLNGGWPHMVKNLTDTVAFGNSYVRPWKMDAFLRFLKQYGVEQASRLVNVIEVVQRWADDRRRREWGVTPGEYEAVMRKWGSWIRAHVARER